MNEIYDVAIIGGGPAGSTAGTILARAGKRVIVLEREKFPRFKIGESFLPYSTPVFERLGIKEELDRCFLPKIGARLATGCSSQQIRFFFKDGFRLKHHSAYQLERATFDKLMLDHAAASGAEVREETRVERIVPGADEIGIETSAGAIRARYVIDCSGRHTVLGQQFGLKKKYPHLNKFSVFSHFEGVAYPDPQERYMTRMIRADDRWFWLIALDERRTSIGVVMDGETFKRDGLSPEETLMQSIASQPEIARLMGDARRLIPVQSTGDYSYRNTRLAGDRWLLAGDAAGFIDPVFSTGVFIALSSGEQAADAVLAALEDPAAREKQFTGYARRLNRVMDLYLRFVSAWYEPEFFEVISDDDPPLRMREAVNAVLAGNVTGGWAIWWRMQLFYLVLRLQRRWALVPRRTLPPGLRKKPEAAPAATAP